MEKSCSLSFVNDIERNVDKKRIRECSVKRTYLTNCILLNDMGVLQSMCVLELNNYMNCLKK